MSNNPPQGKETADRLADLQRELTELRRQNQQLLDAVRNVYSRMAWDYPWFGDDVD